MNVFKHDGHTAYSFKRGKFVLMQYTKDKVRFYFPKAGIVNGLKGLKNIKFRIKPHREFRYWHWTFRLPFFYWNKDNGGFKIGLPNLYLWVIR